MKKTNKSRPKLFCALALLLCLVVPLAMGTYPFGCMEGYFQDGEECQPCESSCKTCSEGTTCDTCEKYMYKNATTGLCEHCEVEEYYNLITKSCETCGTSCDEECMHRPSCMSCDGEKFLDVDDLVCVDACESGKIALNSEHLTHGRICRSAEIFIDHFSSEILELGTQTYPYRTLKSAASEILNHYSHSNFNVTIYTKEAYLQTDTFYVMNMTSITIQNHPDYQRMSQRSNIVITPDPQPGISSKSRVHLLKTINVDPNPFIDQSLYTTTEIGAFLMPKKGFFHLQNERSLQRHQYLRL